MKPIDVSLPKPGLEKLAEGLGFQLSHLARLMKGELEHRLKAVSISPTIATVLVAMLEEDGLSQRDVAARAGLDNATMTRALDVLEARRLIHRHRDGDDRRVQIISLTDQGRVIATDTARISQEINREALHDLTSDERSKLTWLIGEVTAKMESIAQARSII